jgi:hypothetical protein
MIPKNLLKLAFSKKSSKSDVKDNQRSENSSIGIKKPSLAPPDNQRPVNLGIGIQKLFLPATPTTSNLTPAKESCAKLNALYYSFDFGYRADNMNALISAHFPDDLPACLRLVFRPLCKANPDNQ